MTDTIETTENVFEAKARQIVEKIQRDLFRSDIHPSEARKEHIAAIAAALEAERLEERKACAKILMQHSGRFLRQFHEADRISLELGRVVAEVRNWAAAIRSRETGNE
jgi:hypothetical protein